MLKMLAPMLNHAYAPIFIPCSRYEYNIFTNFTLTIDTTPTRVLGEYPSDILSGQSYGYRDPLEINIALLLLVNVTHLRSHVISKAEQVCFALASKKG